MKLFGTMRTNDDGILEIGGMSALDIKKEFGTPLYIVDEKLLRDTCRLFVNNFKSDDLRTEVIYASKAFLNIGMAKLVNEENLSIDVVSGGELYTVLKANFPPEKIYMHGNNKTAEEIDMAIDNNIGTMVIDNKQEIAKVESALESKDKKMDVLLRVNPGIEAHTHEYIQTTNHDSKFGESIFSEDIYDISRILDKSDRLNFKGFHCHIGSQIFEEESFIQAALAMIDFAKDVKDKTGISIDSLNLGGGFGIYYTEEDRPMDLEKFLQRLCKEIRKKLDELELGDIKILIEPGRSIISNAGTTLYEIGGTKETYGGKDYIFIDGGMGDNPRPALYQAKYEGIIANKMNQNPSHKYTIAGKCCESGDIIIRDLELPEAEVGDLLAVSTTGAYNYSMASNYNRIPRPAVVFIKDGKGRIVVKRETYDDLIRNDVL
ncbi:MAG: diaminopimelate decarboxylase [Andreesenia angusta]|nr:diaminopimelate decarboxylase [Andreesenia angusta]